MSTAEVVESLYEAFARGDIPTVLGLLDPEVQWREANPYQPSGEAWVGPDAIVRNLFEKLGEDWAEFTIQPSSFHDAGDVVTVEGRFVGRHGRTGKSLDCQICHLTVENGRITKFQQNLDTGQLQDVAGASR